MSVGRAMLGFPGGLPLQQNGSMTGAITMVLIAGLLLTTVLKLAPVYLDHRVVLEAMQDIAASQEPDSVRLSVVREQLMKSLAINNVQLDSSAVSLMQEQGRQVIRISYETRVYMFYNISVVVAFDDRFPVI